MNGVRQHDLKDCAAASLATVLSYYKSFVPMVHIREKMCVDKNGTSMYALCQTAKHFGLEAEGYEGSLREILDECLVDNLNFPLIAHILTDENMTHYVVIKRITKKYVFLFDPAKGNRKYKICDFENLFTGFFICLKPN